MSRGCRIVRQLFFCERESLFSLACVGCPGDMAGSYLSAFRCSLTARVWKWAVVNKEIILNLLKVRKQAFSHHSSNWR